MSDKENLPVINIRHLMENLQNERNYLEVYLHEMIEMRKSLENKIDAEDVKLSKLNDKINQLEASNSVCEFKAEKLGKEANDLDEKNKSLREAIEDLQAKIDGSKEKRALELEMFENQAVNLCELFGSALFTYSEDSTEAEIEKIYKEIERKRNELAENRELLNKTKNELDDIVLYQAPQNKREMDIPLGQRKLVLNIFEDAHTKAEIRLEHLKSVKAMKETEVYKLDI